MIQRVFLWLFGIKKQQVNDGETITINYKKDIYVNACCDCGLVHTYDFGVHGDNLSMRINVSNKETERLRSEQKFKMKYYENSTQ